MSGWGDLGAILSGGVKRDAEAQYLPQLARNYSAFKALEDAKLVRSQNLSRDSLRESAKQAGASQMAIDTMLSNGTVDFRNTGAAGNPHYFDAQRVAAQAAGIIPNELGAIEVNKDVMNNALGFLKGDPMRRTEIQEGIMFDPHSAKQEGTVTPIGDSMMAENYGSAMASQASAGKYNADTRKTNTETGILEYDLGAVKRGEPPPSKRTDNKGDTDTVKAEEQQELKYARDALKRADAIKDPKERQAKKRCNH